MWEEKQNDFDWNYLLGKFQPCLLVRTPHSRRCEIICSMKDVCANDMRFYRFM